MSTMNHRCGCGASYLVVPKEIPLAEDEFLICDACGCSLKGRWSSRNFDYERCSSFPDEEFDES